jgi:hypothetical protein
LDLGSIPSFSISEVELTLLLTDFYRHAFLFLIAQPLGYPEMGQPFTNKILYLFCTHQGFDKPILHILSYPYILTVSISQADEAIRQIFRRITSLVRDGEYDDHGQVN